MEAAVCNLLSPSDKVITINAGKFGERWTEICKAYGVDAHEIVVERGRSIGLEVLEASLKSLGNVKAVFFQASETSTGVKLPSQEIASLCKKYGALSVCDSITACGVFPVLMGEWGGDGVLTGSQKALMIPPGLSAISLSKKAWEQCEKSSLPKFYFDLKKEKKAQSKGQTAFTPAIGLIRALEESLTLIEREGLDNVYSRVQRLARATRAGVQGLGLKLLAPIDPSPSVTAFFPPEGMDAEVIQNLLDEELNLKVAGGQDELKGKILRFSHFGWIDELDVCAALSGLEIILSRQGYSFQMGCGVGAALECLSKKVSQS